MWSEEDYQGFKKSGMRVRMIRGHVARMVVTPAFDIRSAKETFCEYRL